MIRHRLLVLVLILATAPVTADVAYFESEPNDKPGEYNTTAGAVTLYGSLQGGDQDGYVWTVSDDDARSLWTFELHGIPEARLTQVQIFKLEYADNGVDIASQQSLFKMGTRDATRPSVHEGLIFEPGEYLLGFARAGAVETGGDSEPGAYRFFIRKDSLTIYRNPTANTTPEGAQPVSPGRYYTSFETDETAWYRFDFDEKDAADRWAISVRVPVGGDVKAGLHDANGEELDSRKLDEKGRASFSDLAPPVGTWYLGLHARQPGMIQHITTEATGVRVEGQEAEPNNEHKRANVIDISQPLSGRIGDQDEEDLFVFTVEEAESPSLQTLRLDSATTQKLGFCLMSETWKRIQCRSAAPPLVMSDLLLSPGQWGLQVSGSKPQDYKISFESQGPVDPGREVEPNNGVDLATGVPSNMRIKGRFSGDDTDYFQFYTTGEAQLWRFQANGKGVQAMGYLDGHGKEQATVKAGKGGTRLRLDNLFLLPGRHSIRVRGEDGDYVLLARPLGPPTGPAEIDDAGSGDAEPVGANPVAVTPQAQSPAVPEAVWNPDAEVEPNDKYNMQRLAVGQVRTGTLPDTHDTDHYRFFVANYDHLRLTITPPEDGSIRPYIYWYGYQLGAADDRQPGETITFEGLMPPGDYALELGSESPSDKPYRLSLERLPRFSCIKDCEPTGMNVLDMVSATPPDLRLQGVAQTWRDKDVYQLPSADHDTTLLITSAEPLDRAYLSDGYGEDSSYLDYDDEIGGYRITLPAGHPQRLVITGRGARPYDAQLVFPGGEFAPVTGDPGVQLALELEMDSVGAFLDYGQKLAGKIVASNPGPAPVSVSLEAVTSDYRWSVNLAQNACDIDGGGQCEIRLTVDVPSDAWADHDVRVSVRAMDGQGRQVESWSEVAVSRTAPAVNPRHFWPVPDTLRGGFNAAWLPFGAAWTEDVPKKVQRPGLRDDLVFPGAEMKCCRHGGSRTEGFGPGWTLDLPGDDPLPVAGVAIDSFGVGAAAPAIRQATLLLSMDGVDFTETLHFEALPVLTEQLFALPEPVPARFARLRIEDTFESPPRDVAAGELKVILQPGFDLSAGSGFNIASPVLGGHLVWTNPPDSGAGRVLSEEDKSSWVNLGKNINARYVIGFKRDRAALISRIEWRYHESAGEDDRNFRTVVASVSEHSPVGPWHTVGRMELSSSDAFAVLNLDTPVWARFVRLEAQLDANAKRSREPGVIRIWERPGGDDYLSILTEWGEAGGRAYYESQNDIPRARPPGSENGSRENAAALSLGERSGGSVALGRLQNWYLVRVPQDVNSLSLELTGDPTVRTVLELEDADANPIAVSNSGSGRSPARHRYTAVVEPGQDVWIKVSEPPRNVVFSWDTSGSVGAYIPRIYNSVMAFSGEVQPGYEWVNLLPFAMPFLLSEWSDNPQILQTVLNDFRQESKSSDAEKTLYTAANALARRPGTKAIVLVTDAVTPYFGELWVPMAEIQPRIFGVGVAGSGIAEQNRFRDWAAVNGGDYRQLRYLGEMDVAFDRAATKMHRPARYTLLLEGDFQEAPGPGLLSVVEAEDAMGAAAVELILDASGSMLQRIQGKRRIDIAKEVLTDAVQNQIPPGTPVALRVFGHKEADACRTDLEMPLTPLEPATAAAKIAGINAMNLARTPIADSIEAVQNDLADARTGAIVLVTDGEETCDGDPGAAIEGLREKGYEVNLNIVGFAIDDAELAARFEAWAELGGGRYFAASDQDGLSDAIEQALRIPYTVFDRDGNAVATGEVGGEPLTLERGNYRVIVNTSKVHTFENVEIRGEDEVSLELE